ncbi:Prepilin peptidase [Planctomycetales bacterium 10988]|nr:Prepilin peptidase [Planctomycetales bacterium 10988]
MNDLFWTWLEVPLWIRILWLMVVGSCIGSFLNVLVYRIPREETITGFSHCPACNHALSWRDNIPVLGWFLVRGKCRYCKASISSRYWIFELLTAIAFGALYWWEVDQLALLPTENYLNRSEWSELIYVHYCYLTHVLLFCLMLTASLIDLDEFIIPDEITVPGTLFGLGLAAWWPASRLPVWTLDYPDPLMQFWGPLLATGRDNYWPAWLDQGDIASLLLALGCFLGWCLALLPWRWRFRRGLRWALRLQLARIFRWSWTWRTFLAALISFPAIVLFWFLLPELHWRTFLSAMIGMVGGGSIVWTIRILGRVTLGREAMGFGDVVLVAMIGSFLGWQASLMLFFIAPLFGLVFALGLALSRKSPYIPYGPYLCLGGLTVILAWQPLWDQFGRLFSDWLLAAALGICLVVLTGMLFLLRIVRMLTGRE